MTSAFKAVFFFFLKLAIARDSGLKKYIEYFYSIVSNCWALVKVNVMLLSIDNSRAKIEAAATVIWRNGEEKQVCVNNRVRSHTRVKLSWPFWWIAWPQREQVKKKCIFYFVHFQKLCTKLKNANPRQLRVYFNLLTPFQTFVRSNKMSRSAANLNREISIPFSEDL